MKKITLQHYFTLLLFLTLRLAAFSQGYLDSSECSEFIDLGIVRNSNEDFSTFESLKNTLKDVEIVMLGEQSHGEGIVYETKIKLVKYLHQEMGFDLLVFESGIYSCNKAWEKIKKGEDVPISLANSIFPIWSTTKQFRPLAKYIEEHKNSKIPLIISGFDNQLTGRIPEKEFIGDLKEFILKKDKAIINSKEWRNLEISLQYIFKYELKKYKKSQVIKDTTFINTIINKVNSNDSLSRFWVHVLKSTKYFISDTKLKTNFRDKQMAENLMLIKEQNPNKKIICWGATSHFLYNSSEIRLIGFPYNVLDNHFGKQPMMGEYLKKKYKSKIFTIGFIAYQGEFGFTAKRKIKPAKENSLEYLIEKSGFENCFLNLNKCNSGELISRPLGNKYMKNNISNVMDGVIFNKNMERSLLDRNLYLKIFPENKWVKPEVEE